jgi:hypothetical protein
MKTTVVPVWQRRFSHLGSASPFLEIDATSSNGEDVSINMNRAAFERRWRADLKHAEATLLKDGTLEPLFIVVGRDGRTLLLPGDFRSEATKRRSADTVRLAAVASDAELAILRCESWVVMGQELPAGVTPANSDRRIEVVSVMASVRIGGRIAYRASLREIVRGTTGRPEGLRELPDALDGAGLEGPMVDLLPPNRPTAEQRALAAALLAAMAERED